MKKMIAATMAVTLLTTTAPASASSRFADVDEVKYAWATEAIDFLADQGIITGYVDGTFKPNKLVTKAEFAHMYNNLLPKEREGAELPPDFVDAKTSWAAKDFSELFNWDSWTFAETIIGSNGEKKYLNPNRQLTRWDVAVLAGYLTEEINIISNHSWVEDSDVLRAIGNTFYDVKFREREGKENHNIYYPVLLTDTRTGRTLFADDIEQLKGDAFYSTIQSGVMTGSDDYFRPNAYVTRAEAATILYRLYNAVHPQK